MDQVKLRPFFGVSDKIPLAIVSLFALAFAVCRVFIPSVRAGIDNTVIALLVIAALPWISAVVKKLQAGGVTFEAQERLDRLESRADEQQKRAEAQQQLINSLVTSGMGEWVYVHLREVAKRQLEGHGEYKYRPEDPNMRRDLRFLIDHGYVEPFDLDKPADLASEMKIKESGLIYVLFRGDPARVPPTIDAQYLRPFNR